MPTVPDYYMLGFPVLERESEDDCSQTTYLELINENERLSSKRSRLLTTLRLGLESGCPASTKS